MILMKLALRINYKFLILSNKVHSAIPAASSISFQITSET